MFYVFVVWVGFDCFGVGYCVGYLGVGVCLEIVVVW